MTDTEKNYPKSMIVRKLARCPDWEIAKEFTPTGVDVSEQEWIDARTALLAEWSNVPDRYKVRATDADGMRFYYTKPPHIHTDSDLWERDPESTHYDVWVDDDYIASEVDIVYWKYSIETRPYGV